MVGRLLSDDEAGEGLMKLGFCQEVEEFDPDWRSRGESKGDEFSCSNLDFNFHLREVDSSF